jgi:hypothetical protein
MPVAQIDMKYSKMSIGKSKGAGCYHKYSKLMLTKVVRWFLTPSMTPMKLERLLILRARVPIPIIGLTK